MFQSKAKAKAEKLISELNFTDCNFFLEQDSKKIKGIQLADLAAHIASIQFKYSLGLVTKKVKAGENSGYDPEDEMELGFEMWATLRSSFFCKNSGKPYMADQLIDATMIVERCGLYISDLGNEEFTGNVKAAFGTVNLGCIH